MSLETKMPKYNSRPYRGRGYLGSGARLVPIIRAALDELGFDEIEVMPDSLDCLVDGVTLKVVKQKEFDKACKQNGDLDEGVKGFVTLDDTCIYVLNRIFEKGISMVGHEIGHILTEELEDGIDEQAKAIAFEYAWCHAVQKTDLVDPPFRPLSLFLRQTFNENEDPKYYIATKFVKKNAHSLEEALALFHGFSNGSVTVPSKFRKKYLKS